MFYPIEQIKTSKDLIEFFAVVYEPMIGIRISIDENFSIMKFGKEVLEKYSHISNPKKLFQILYYEYNLSLLENSILKKFNILLFNSLKKTLKNIENTKINYDVKMFTIYTSIFRNLNIEDRKFLIPRHCFDSNKEDIFIKYKKKIEELKDCFLFEEIEDFRFFDFSSKYIDDITLMSEFFMLNAEIEKINSARYILDNFLDTNNLSTISLNIKKEEFIEEISVFVENLIYDNKHIFKEESFTDELKEDLFEFFISDFLDL